MFPEKNQFHHAGELYKFYFLTKIRTLFTCYRWFYRPLWFPMRLYYFPKTCNLQHSKKILFGGWLCLEDTFWLFSLREEAVRVSGWVQTEPGLGGGGLLRMSKEGGGSGQVSNQEPRPC